MIFKDEINNIEERNIVKSSESLLKDYDEKNGLRYNLRQDEENLDIKSGNSMAACIISGGFSAILGFISILCFIAKNAHPDNVGIFFTFFSLFLVAAAVLIPSVIRLKIKTRKLENTTQELNEVDEYIKRMIVKKFYKDLKDQYGASLVNKNAPYSGMKNETYEIVLEDGNSVYAEIEYDANGSMIVRVVSKIETLTNRNPDTTVKKNSKKFDLKESLSNV